MRLAVSNIAWSEEEDESVYALMRESGFAGLEIAPTRLFPDRPYERLSEVRAWAERLAAEQGFCVPSMQSIWRGRTENLFGTDEERETLLDCTRQAMAFASAAGCRNLVFGCPKNRIIPRGISEEEVRRTALAFFRTAAAEAKAFGTVIGLEANPALYGTNFINRTEEALALIRDVDSPGLRLNLDTGTMIQNSEASSLLQGAVSLISHVHFSEPGLRPLRLRALHAELLRLLEEEGYQGWISIEMASTGGTGDLAAALKALRELADSV